MNTFRDTKKSCSKGKFSEKIIFSFWEFSKTIFKYKMSNWRSDSMKNWCRIKKSPGVSRKRFGRLPRFSMTRNFLEMKTLIDIVASRNLVGSVDVIQCQDYQSNLVFVTWDFTYRCVKMTSTGRFKDRYYLLFYPSRKEQYFCTWSVIVMSFV